MNRSTWIAALGACLLAACASQAPVASRVQEVKAEDGSRSVSSAPARLICEQPRCPTLSAHWRSTRAAVIVLTIDLPGQSAKVTGADFHFGASQIVRLRVPSTSQPGAADKAPGTSFDVPASLIDAVAYKPRGWVRVLTEGGGNVDEAIQTGEERSEAATTMGEFLRVVDAVAGTPGEGRGGRGGLFDLFK